MALKKSQIYSFLWQSCDELRGGMDASQYKDYVLVLLFLKYVSDKYAGVPFAPITIPEGASFNDLVALKGKPDIGDQINKKIVGPLAKANNLSDMPDFNDPAKLGSGQEMVERLTNLIAIFQSAALDFSKNRAEGDDILGDAYEYLMRHFATESGKSKGQFYTPAEVSRIMAQILGIGQADITNNTTVYDPTCGSGSLLLKVADEASGKAKVTLYGQEKDATTAGLARMNMILHDNAGALILPGNTLANPRFTTDDGQLKTFDYVVANPPFSDKRWSTGLNPTKDPHERFKSFGVPPAKQGDYAYLLHIVRSLRPTGKGACILPNGVLFRGNAEAEIRRNLVRRGYIKGIIGLPANLFYGTGIPACIVVIDKEDAHTSKGIFMIDASSGFMKDGPKNRLRAMDIHKIVDVFNRRQRVDKFSRMVSVEEIEAKEFSLYLPRYIDAQPPEDIHDIDGHLRGGIPARDIDALDRYWVVCPGLRTVLFEPNRYGYFDLAVAKESIKATIHQHSEFVAFTESMNKHFAEWRKSACTWLKSLTIGFHPKVIIARLSEGLLAHYVGRPLVNPYDVYQHIMDYWAGTMQDDCYLISASGWKAETERIIVKDKKGREKDKGWTCDLVPKRLVVARFFSDESQRVDALRADVEQVSSQIEELQQEHDVEDGALFGVSSLKEAETARADALLLAWAATDPAAHVTYVVQLTEAAEAEARLTSLANKPALLSLGRLTQKALKAAIKTAGDPDARADLEHYLALTASAKAARASVDASYAAGAARITAMLASRSEDETLADLRVLDRYIAATHQLQAAETTLTDAEDELDQLAYGKYPMLTEEDVQLLVVEDKWLAALDADVHGEMDRISRDLSARVRELAERYDAPLPAFARSVNEMELKVNSHLERMGFTWAK